MTAVDDKLKKVEDKIDNSLNKLSDEVKDLSKISVSNETPVILNKDVKQNKKEINSINTELRKVNYLSEDLEQSKNKVNCLSKHLEQSKNKANCLSEELEQSKNKVK